MARRMSEVRAYSRAKSLVERRFAFMVHIAVFLPINGILWFLDLTFEFDQSWAWIVSWAWGIGLATHCVSTFILADSRPRTPLEELLRDRRVVFYLHLFAFFNSVALFWVANAYGPAPMATLGQGKFGNWAFWPTLFWGLALFYHWFFTFVVRGWRVKKWKQRWTLRVMEALDGVPRPEKEEPGSEQRP